MTKSQQKNSETLLCQAFKNLCCCVGLIQDFFTCLIVGGKYLLRLHIAELFAICSIEKIKIFKGFKTG